MLKDAIVIRTQRERDEQVCIWMLMCRGIGYVQGDGKKKKSNVA